MKEPNGSGVMYQSLRQATCSHPGASAIEYAGESLTYSDCLSAVLHTVLGFEQSGLQPGSGSPIAFASQGGFFDFLAVMSISAVGSPIVPVPRLTDSELNRLARIGVRWICEPQAGSATRLRIDPLPVGIERMRIPPGTEYVLSTSGSTRRPKDVPIAAGNLRTLLDNYRSGHVEASDRVALTYEPTFDPWFWVVGMSVNAGACLVVAAPHERLQAISFISRNGVTIWSGVPTLGRLALRADARGPGACDHVRHVYFGGEALDADLVERWRNIARHARIHNCYGPAEATINAFEYSLAPLSSLPAPEVGVPLGSPLTGVELKLIGAGHDEYELCLRGEQLFEGYLCSKDNSGRFLLDDAPRFDRVSKRLSSRSGSWFRTGDLVRFHGGELYFSRRIDREVKIRGRRLDLDLIAQELRSVAGVRGAWVGIFDRHIYAVLEGNRERSAKNVELAALRLRSYARPHGYAWVDSMPLLGNGKHDLRRLNEIVKSLGQN